MSTALSLHPDTPCPSCVPAGIPVALDGLRAAVVYEGPVRLAILALKYNGQRRLAEPLGNLLTAAASREYSAVDVVIPIPLHAARQRQRQRGYNQAELLARRCAAQLGVPCEAKVLRRTRATRPQVGLSSVDRYANVQGALELAAPAFTSRVAGKRVLLVDDVTTTGSTLDAAATVLRLAQPAALYGLAVTRPDLADDVRDAAGGAHGSAHRSRSV